jgi:membrane protease YdiL (CAAX protease family)
LFKNKEGKVRSGWLIAGILGAVYLASLILGVIISVIAIVYYTMKMSASGGLNSGNLTDMLSTMSQGNSMLNLLLMPVQEALYIIIPVFTWKKLLKRPLSNMGLTRFKIHRKDFISGLLFGVAAITAVFLGLFFSGAIYVTKWTPTFTVDQFIYIFIFISVGFAEEILGRGYIMSVLRRTGNLYAVVIISAVIFALLHGLNPGIGIVPLVNLMLYGILAAYMYLRSGNLWMCIGFHITWNYFQGCVYGLKVSGLETNGIITTEVSSGNLWNGGDFGPEGGLFVTLILCLLFLIVHLYYKHSKFDFMAAESINNQNNLAN